MWKLHFFCGYVCFLKLSPDEFLSHSNFVFGDSFFWGSFSEVKTDMMYSVTFEMEKGR